MSTTLFKLTSPPPESMTRRVAYFTRPIWDELATKIESIYGIPRDKVCVSYIDNDGDEVTLSSDEELQDYYRFNVKSNEPGNDAIKVVRFTVRDSTQGADKPLPHTPRSSNFRYTFGPRSLGSMLEGEEDWQRIPAFDPSVFPILSTREEDEGPHAYVETIASEASTPKEKQEQEEEKASEGTDSERSSIKVDKGKRRASVEDVPDIDDSLSHVSVVDAETPDKQPIHFPVRQASFTSSLDTFGLRRPGAAPASVSEMELTPKVEPETPKILQADDIEVKVEEATVKTQSTTDTDAPDPPLPELEDISSPSPTTSLVNDVASLINSFSSVLASHPELAEGLRNVVRNAADGTYWGAHREAVARAAEEVRRSAESSAGEVRRAAEEIHRAAEEAAGRRVAEAIGNVMRTIGQYTGAVGASALQGEPISTPLREETGGQEQTRPSQETMWFTPSRTHAAPNSFSDLFYPRTRGASRPLSDFLPLNPGFSNNPWQTNPVSPPQVPAVPPPQSPPQPVPVMPSGVPPQPVPVMPSGIPPPPVPVPPPPCGLPIPPPPPPILHGWGIVPGSPAGFWPPPPPPPLAFGSPLNASWLGPQSRQTSESTAPGAETSFSAALQSPASGLVGSKERLEAAKEAYKEEKERYRKDREARRAAEREARRMRNASGDSAQPASGEQKEDEGMQSASKDQDPKDQESKDEDMKKGVDIKTEAPEGAVSDQAGPTPAASTSAQLPATPEAAASARFPAMPERRPSAAQKNAPQAVPVSAARGPFPQLEMFSVSPRRHNTIHGTAHLDPRTPSRPPPQIVGVRPSPRSENPFLASSIAQSRSQASDNITRRLADMGFTTDKFQRLPFKVGARVRTLTAVMTQEQEDTAVQEIVEELLAQPATAKASGSGLRRSQTTTGMPGGFN